MTVVPQAGITAGLAAYLEARDREEQGRVEDALRGMNPRERGLVREVAVMAYVRGHMAGRAQADARDFRDDYPGDRVVLAGVISACLHMPELYRVMSRVERIGARRAARQRDGGQS